MIDGWSLMVDHNIIIIWINRWTTKSVSISWPENKTKVILILKTSSSNPRINSILTTKESNLWTLTPILTKSKNSPFKVNITMKNAESITIKRPNTTSISTNVSVKNAFSKKPSIMISIAAIRNPALCVKKRLKTLWSDYSRSKSNATFNKAKSSTKSKNTTRVIFSRWKKQSLSSPRYRKSYFRKKIVIWIW